MLWKNCFCVFFAIAVAAKNSDLKIPLEFFDDQLTLNEPDPEYLQEFENFPFIDENEEDTELVDIPNDESRYPIYGNNELDDKKEYFVKRRDHIASDDSQEVGYNLTLNDMQSAVNNIIYYHKKQEIQDSYLNMKEFPAALHFIRAKKFMQRSKFYSIIKKIPKGCNLNVHLLGAVGADTYVKLTQNDPDLLVCFKVTDGVQHLLFTRFRSENDGCTEYFNVMEMREASGDPRKFDEKMRSYFILGSTKPEFTNWGKPGSVIEREKFMFPYMENLCFLRSNFETCVNSAVESQVNDNCLCIEFRHLLSPLVNDDGTKTTEMETAKILERILLKNQEKYKIYIKIIITAPLWLPVASFERRIDVVNRIHEYNKNMFIGMDFLGSEDYNSPIKSFYKPLQQLKAKLFCTVGQSKILGSNGDMNCYDAFLLNCTRISNAFACPRHPSLWKKMQEKKIPLELSPIFNQAMGLVQDLRNHPGVYHTSYGNLFVVGTVIPGLLESSLSDDFYYIAMAWNNDKTGGKTLRQLTTNSINYSSLNAEEKADVLARHGERSIQFMMDIVEGNY